jgi:uncharacterized membrane protein YedE/YeeE
MSIDWTHFTPFSALAGGAMIGAAAALLILGVGRVMGAAGILGGALEARGGEAAWRWSLIAGLAAAPSLAQVLWGASAPTFAAGWLVLLVSGLLVGFGARLGSGCTSGHGVCGLARLSPRSFVATALFMAAGFATVFVVRHVVV